MSHKTKQLVSLMIAFLIAGSIGFANCKKKENDKTSLFAALFTLTARVPTTASSSSTSVSGSTALSANTPLGRQVTVAAGSTVTQKVNIAGSATSVQESRSQTRATSTATLTLSLYKSDGTYVDGCPDVVSTPGATSVSLTCTIATAGTYVIQLKSTGTATVSFDAPVGATVVVTTTGSSGFEALSTVFATDPTISVTKNIFIGGPISRNFIFPTVYKYDTTTKAMTPVTDAVVKATFKTNAEVTLTYTCFSGVCGYGSTSSLVPSTSTLATGGDQIRIKITAADGSYSIDKTLTYPNSISNVKIGGTALALNTTYTVSRAAGTTISWDNPSSNAPQFVAITPGPNVGNLTTIPWLGLFYVAASAGTATISSSVLNTYSTVTSTTATDNCLGVSGALTGNIFAFPTFYNGEALFNGTNSIYSSGFVISNASGLLTMAGIFAPEGYACESGTTNGQSTTTWSSTNPKLVVTE